MTHLNPADWVASDRPSTLPEPVDVHRVADLEPGTMGLPAICAAAARGPQLISTERDRVRVRFWHQAPSATAVALAANGWWHPRSPADCDLSRVRDGWWTGTFEVPDDWQVSYRFLEHRGLTDPPWWLDGIKAHAAYGVIDGLNPLRQSAGRLGPSSLLRMPSAAQPWLNGVPSPAPGPLQLGGSRRAWWWAIDAVEPLPLLILTDGAVHVELLGTHRLLAAAVECGALPPLAAVFVDAGPDRARSLAAPDGQALWIADSLVPQLRATGLGRSAITSDPQRTMVAGSSFGALAALFAVAQAPQIVGGACALSPSLWRYQPELFDVALDAANRVAPVRLWLGAGRYENPALMATLASSLASAGVDVDSQVHSGGHDWAWWVPALIHAAIHAFGSPQR